MPDTGALLVATPAKDDPINDLSEEDFAHISLLWFGEADNLSADLVIALRLVAATVAARMEPFTVDVAGVAVIGQDGASVLIVESYDLVELRDILAMDSHVQEAMAGAERQFPSWIPHLTLRYDGALPQNPPTQISIDAIGLWIAGQKSSYPLSALELDGDTEEMLAAGLTIPPIYAAADLPMGLRFGAEHPTSRWYVARRATALKCAHLIPEQWTRS